MTTKIQKMKWELHSYKQKQLLNTFKNFNLI